MGARIPLTIFGFNRPKSLQQVVDAIKSQSVMPPLVYAFIDGSNNPADHQLIADCERVVKSLPIPTIVMRRDANFGCAKNIMHGLDTVLMAEGATAVLEDDVIPTPHWFETICEMLSQYFRVPDIGAVGTFPSLLNGALPDCKHDVVFSSRFCPWGWGTSLPQWRCVSADWHAYMAKQLPWNPNLLPGDAGGDIAAVLNNHDHGKLWDAVVVGTFLARNLRQACTRHYMVKNIGASLHLSHSRLAYMYANNPQCDMVPTSFPIPADIDYSATMAAVRSYVTAMS